MLRSSFDLASEKVYSKRRRKKTLSYKFYLYKWKKFCTAVTKKHNLFALDNSFLCINHACPWNMQIVKRGKMCLWRNLPIIVQEKNRISICSHQKSGSATLPVSRQRGWMCLAGCVDGSTPGIVQAIVNPVNQCASKHRHGSLSNLSRLSK